MSGPDGDTRAGRHCDVLGLRVVVNDPGRAQASSVEHVGDEVERVERQWQVAVPNRGVSVPPDELLDDVDEPMSSRWERSLPMRLSSWWGRGAGRSLPSMRSAEMISATVGSSSSVSWLTSSALPSLTMQAAIARSGALNS
jgi:hypothetical protein